MGRPVTKWDSKAREELKRKFDQYVERTKLPIIARFAAMNRIPKQYMYDFKELSESIKIAMAKKEAELEEGGLKGKYSAAMAIFSLKQMGWKDRQELTGADGKNLIQKVEIEIVKRRVQDGGSKAED